MKGRESGMPAEAFWESFFDAEAVVARLLGQVTGNTLELGCGYGTFTLVAARRTTGQLLALDIEPLLVDALRQKAARAGLANILVAERDFLANGTGCHPASMAHVMLYNLLHVEAPLPLLREVARVLKPGGILSVIHWRSDIKTPRGPPRAIRPSPEACRAWILAAGFQEVEDVALGARTPFHFGLRAKR